MKKLILMLMLCAPMTMMAGVAEEEQRVDAAYRS